ncbi:MAG: acyclic terpene utilization AtuA family protein, partial [Acidimicrobiia bacterium]
MTDPIRIANCSGFYGDRIAAAREMVEGGPIDVLTGDWLAELTMLILQRTRAKRPHGGYARTFVTQMEQVMGTCLDQGIKVVSNAGGLDPDGCADAIAEVADKLGLSPTIAYVNGDDILGRLDELVAAGIDLAHFDTGEPIGDTSRFITANAYLGCWGIVEALNAGADIVAMREIDKRLPTWNYKGEELDLWHLDQRINDRGVAVDLELAQAAIDASERTKAELAARTADLTGGEVQATTQRDALLAHL